MLGCLTTPGPAGAGKRCTATVTAQPPRAVPDALRRSDPPSITPARNSMRTRDKTAWSQTRSSIACINSQCGIDSKQLAMSVSTTQRRPCHDSSMSTCKASCAERLGRNPKLHGRKSASKDRLERDLHSGLHDPVADSGNRERPLLIRARLRDEHPPGRQRPVPSLLQFRSQLIEQPGYPVLLDSHQADPVDTRCAAVAAHLLPCPVQHVPAVELVRTAHGTVFQGRPRPPGKAHAAKLADPVRLRQPPGWTLAVLLGTHRSGPPSLRANEAAALPSPRVVLSRRSERYYGRLRLPPGRRPLPGSTPVIRRRFPRQPQHAPSWEGLPSSRRHHLNVPRPLTPESPSRLPSRIFTASMAFAVNRPARLSSRCLTTRQASLTLRTAQLLPLKGLSTLGSDPARFQARPPACDRGSLAITRTGLPPAGDDELPIRS